MQFIKNYGFLILSLTFTLIGLLTLMFSVNLGTNAASAYLSSMGGMETAVFNAIQSQYIISNMIIGGILLFLGSAFLLFSVYKLSRENNNTKK